MTSPVLVPSTPGLAGAAAMQAMPGALNASLSFDRLSEVLVCDLAQWLQAQVLAGRVSDVGGVAHAANYAEWLRGSQIGEFAHSVAWLSLHPLFQQPRQVREIAQAGPLADHWAGGGLLFISPNALQSFIRDHYLVDQAAATELAASLLCELVRQNMAQRPHGTDLGDVRPAYMRGVPDPARWTFPHWVRPWGVEVYASIFRALPQGNAQATVAPAEGSAAHARTRGGIAATVAHLVQWLAGAALLHTLPAVAGFDLGPMTWAWRLVGYRISRPLLPARQRASSAGTPPQRP